MNVLALDLGNTTGYAFAHITGTCPLHSGSVSFKPTRFQSQGWRYVRFSQWLSEMKLSFPFNRVVFEEVHRHAGTVAAHVYGGMLAALTSWCALNDIEYSGYSVQAIKKFATGKGNATKELVIQAVEKRWNQSVLDDNQADACALLMLHLQTVNASVEKNAVRPDFMD